MTLERPRLRFLLDEGVPHSVGVALQETGHEVIFHHEALAKAASDLLVCAASVANQAVLIAIDNDMRSIARSFGVSNREYRTLSLLKLNCRETKARTRVIAALTLIEQEWVSSPRHAGRRIYIEIGDSYIRTNR